MAHACGDQGAADARHQPMSTSNACQKGEVQRNLQTSDLRAEVRILPGAPDLVFPIPVLIGAIFVVCVLLFRRGLVGEIRDWAAHRTAG